MDGPSNGMYRDPAVGCMQLDAGMAGTQQWDVG